MDVWPRKFKYCQAVHRTQLHAKQQNIASEIQLLIGLRLGFNNQSVLTQPVWNSILQARGDLTKSIAAEAYAIIIWQKSMQRISH